MGRRSGKSYMAAHEIMPWLLTPNTRGWIVGPNYSLANKIAREVKRIVITELKLPIEIGIKLINLQMLHMTILERWIS